jgi:hypothetical protein
MEDRGSNRKGTRVALEARVQGRTFPAQLYDVSPTGCRIDCSTMVLSRRDRITFRFADEIAVAGKIVWLRGGFAGVQFYSPLPEAIARHLRPQVEADD